MIGKMDQMISIERKTFLADAMGGTVETWAHVYSVWAMVKAKAGREVVDQGRTNATFVVNFTIRALADLSEVDRIVWNGDRYNIRGVLRASTRELHLVIEAERGVSS